MSSMSSLSVISFQLSVSRKRRNTRRVIGRNGVFIEKPRGYWILSDKSIAAIHDVLAAAIRAVLAVSHQLSAFSKMQGAKRRHKNRIADFEGKRVTKWSLFFDEVANDFEGGRLLRGLGDSKWKV